MPLASAPRALAPDATLRAGTSGSFNAAGYCLVSSPDGRPVFRLSGPMGAGDERWRDGFGLPGASFIVLAAACSGTDVFVGGYFTVIGGVPAQRVAKWNGTAWSPLGAGLDDLVQTLAVSATGQLFATAGGAPAHNIAKWDGAQWSALGTGTNGGFWG